MSPTVRLTSFAGTITLVVAVCLICGFLITQNASTSAGEVRVIHLVVRDMAFYFTGRDEPNPTLHLRRGERVRIVLTNQDAGMKHDFGVDAWQTRTRLIDGIGEARIELMAPSVAGDALYSCTPHGTLMRGTIRVE